MRRLMAATPKPLDFVLPGFVAGTVGGLLGPGGTGKSFWALEAAVQIAAGSTERLLGMNTAPGRVIYLSGEDTEQVLAQRLHALKPHLSADPDLAQLEYIDCTRVERNLIGASWLQNFIHHAAGARLIIIDTLRRFHRLDENNAGDMTLVVAAMENIAAETGAAVLYLHHPSKLSVTSGQGSMQQAARGSSVLVDNARWCAYLAGMTEKEGRLYGVPAEHLDSYVAWNINKQNYGAQTRPTWYRRATGGVLVPVDLAPVPKQSKTSPRKGIPAPGSNPSVSNNSVITESASTPGVTPQSNHGADPGSKELSNVPVPIPGLNQISLPPGKTWHD